MSVWPFKSHLGSESLGYREGKELMSEDGWAARWGLMLMGELKLSTQTLRGQNCRSVFLMLTPPPQTRAVNLPSQLGEGGARKKREMLEMLTSPFSCFFPYPVQIPPTHPPLPRHSFVLSQSLLPTYEPFPLKFPNLGFPLRIERMVSACRI